MKHIHFLTFTTSLPLLSPNIFAFFNRLLFSHSSYGLLASPFFSLAFTIIYLHYSSDHYRASDSSFVTTSRPVIYVASYCPFSTHRFAVHHSNACSEYIAYFEICVRKYDKQGGCHNIHMQVSYSLP